MTFLPSCSSISALYTSRPPLAIFLCSLVLISITTFSLALYVHSKDRLDNPDILDWNRLLKEMSQMKYCLSQSNSTTSSSVMKAPQSTNASSLPLRNSSLTTVSRRGIYLTSNLLVNFPLGSSFNGLGSIPLDHMGLGHNGEQVEVLMQQTQGESSVCMEVRGKPDVLARLKSEVNSLNISDKNEYTEKITENGTSVKSKKEAPGSRPCPDSRLGPSRNFTVHFTAHLPRAWCDKGEEFPVRWIHNPSWATPLTLDERAISVFHLLISSAVLLLIVIMSTFCCSIGRSKGVRRRMGGDSRGDMQLLPTQQD